MRWLSILKKVGIVAGKTVVDVAAASNPLIGGLTDVIFRNVLSAEGVLGPGKGEQKRDMVLGAIEAASPLILRLAEQGAGKDLADDDLFARGVTKITEGMVDVMNSFRILPKEQK